MAYYNLTDTQMRLARYLVTFDRDNELVQPIRPIFLPLPGTSGKLILALKTMNIGEAQISETGFWPTETDFNALKDAGFLGEAQDVDGQWGYFLKDRAYAAFEQVLEEMPRDDERRGPQEGDDSPVVHAARLTSKTNLLVAIIGGVFLLLAACVYGGFSLCEAGVIPFCAREDDSISAAVLDEESRSSTEPPHSTSTQDTALQTPTVGAGSTLVLKEMIRAYYELIRQDNCGDAWEMLDSDFRDAYHSDNQGGYIEYEAYCRRTDLISIDDVEIIVVTETKVEAHIDIQFGDDPPERKLIILLLDPFTDSWLLHDQMQLSP